MRTAIIRSLSMRAVRSNHLTNDLKVNIIQSLPHLSAMDFDMFINHKLPYGETFKCIRSKIEGVDPGEDVPYLTEDASLNVIRWIMSELH